MITYLVYVNGSLFYNNISIAIDIVIAIMYTPVLHTEGEGGGLGSITTKFDLKAVIPRRLHIVSISLFQISPPPPPPNKKSCMKP